MHKRPLHTTIFCRLWNKKQFRSQAAVQVQTWRFPRPERHYCSYLKEKNKHRRKCAVFEQKETVTALTEASSREKSIKGICFIIFAQSSIKTPCCHTSWQLRGRKRKARLHLAGIICVGTKQQKAGIPKRNLSFFPHFFFFQGTFTNLYCYPNLFRRASLPACLFQKAAKISSIKRMTMPWHKPARTCNN